jgi:2-methylfumaryl-CoA hydratase
MTTHTPRYGRMLSDFEVGATYAHPWDVTIDGGAIALFQASFQDASPTYASRVYAQSLGFRDRPVHPLLLLNLGLSFSVHDVSEQAIAHLAYLDVRFPAPCYPGDTVTAQSRVLGVKPASSGDRGVVHVRTALLAEDGRAVCVFERKALVRAGRLEGRPADAVITALAEPPADLPALPEALRTLPAPPARPAGFGGFFEDFAPGDVVLHQLGKTVGESEHMQLTALVRNSHPLHFDEHYAKVERQSFQGTRVVYGGLVFAWVASLASRDVAGNAAWELGFDEGAHPSGVLAGDTLYAASRVLEAKALDACWGELTFRLVGTKNARPATLLAAGRDLFTPELAKEKDARVPEKVFEITRKMLVRRR